jgi:organic radical activating enzyme
MLTEIINHTPKDVLTIEYMLGNLCNHKCSYCFPGSNTGTVPWPDVNIVLKNLDHLFSVYKKVGKTKFDLYLLGGEPTLWKDLEILCENLKLKHDINIRISTNGTRSLSWWKRYGKNFNRVELSVHHEFAKVDHLSQIADQLFEDDINLVANVLMDPDHFEKCKNIVEHLKQSKHEWTIFAKSVHFGGKTRYTEEQKNYLTSPVKRYPNEEWWNRIKPNDSKELWAIIDGNKIKVRENWFALNDLNHFKGWTCNLGVDHIEIFQDGTISGNCKQQIYNMPYYNLYDIEFENKFSPTIQPIICQKNTCECTYEISISKKDERV